MTALSLPSNPVNGQKHIHADKVYIYNSSKGYWKVAGSEAVSDAAASLFTSQDTVHSANIATLYTLVEDSQGVTSYANTSLLPLSGVSAGSMAFVSGSNRLYISNGTGWYSISLVNTNPNITSVQDASSGNSPFTLATDGTATVITITANDPEQVPLTYNYSVTSGSLTNGGGTTATVTQSDNVFTVTPSTTEAYAGTFELTFTASDGVNTSTNANSFTLSFITYVTNSNYTTLLSTPTAPNSTVYRYFKFLPQEMRSATPDAMQYSEFELTDGTSYYSPDSASQLYRADDTDGDDYVASQRVAASIDGSTSTKLFNGSWATKYYLYDMGSSFNTVLTGWRYKTGDDVDGRDPVSWTLLGSTNNTDWVILDQRTQETITTTRQTATQDFLFNSSNQIIQNHANSNYPIAVNGDAHAGTFSPYRSGGYSTKFEPNSYFNILNQPAIGSGDCSIECWVNVSTLSQWHGIIKRGGNNQAGNFQFYVRNDTEVYLNWSGSSAGTAITTSGANIQPNTWYWLQVIRSSGTVNIYVNGVSKASFSDSSNISSTTYYDIGGWTSYYSDALIRDLRVSTVARSSSTGPSDKLEVDSDTTFLTCNLPYVTFSTPSAVNNYVQYISGPVSTKPFSPYDYLEYSTTDHGGSVYFDGSNDDLTITDHSAFDLSTGNWTVEFWWNPKSVNTNEGPMSVGYGSGSTPTGLKFAWENDKLYAFSMDGSTLQTGLYHDATAASLVNRWNHVAAVYNGTNTDLYLNGVASGRAQSTNFGENSSDDVRIGSVRRLSSIHYSECSISDVRIVKGTAVYSGNFTPPTGPLTTTGGTYPSTTNVNTSITASNTSLLIKGIDASIIDKSQGSNLKLEGSVAGSTNQVRSGAWVNTKTMKFDSVDDLINLNGVLDLSQACTWEAWVYFDNHPDASGFMHMFQSASYSSTDPPFGIRFKTTGGMKINFVLYTTSGNHEVSSPNAISLDTWYHLAFSRTSSGVYNVYIDGTRYSTFTESATYQSAGDVMVIGNSGTGSTPARYLDGYMQDIRITQGLARYTAADETSNIPSAPLEG